MRQAIQVKYGIRIQLQRVPEFGFGFTRLVEIQQDGTQRVVGGRHIGFVAQRQTKFGRRGRQVLRTHQRHAKVIMRFRGMRFHPDGFPESGHRTLQFALLREPCSDRVVYFGGRMLADRLDAGCRGLALFRQLRGGGQGIAKN